MDAKQPILTMNMTTAHDIEKIVCHRCCAVLDVGDKYCRHCGVALDGRFTPAPARPAPARKVDEPGWTESRWAVLTALFLVLGALAIPMLWRSRQFSRGWKIVLTILVLILTAVVLWLAWYVVNLSIIKPLMQLREQMGQ